MRRIATGIALIALLGLAACGDSRSTSESRTKNAALDQTTTTAPATPPTSVAAPTSVALTSTSMAPMATTTVAAAAAATSIAPSTAVAPTTTVTACAPSLKNGVLNTCKVFTKIDYTLFNRNYSVGSKDLQYGSIYSNASLAKTSETIPVPPVGMMATITYADGTSAPDAIYALTEKGGALTSAMPANGACNPYLSNGVFYTCKVFTKIDYTLFNRNYSVGSKDLQYGSIYSNASLGRTTAYISLPPIGIKVTVTYADGTTTPPTIFPFSEKTSGPPNLPNPTIPPTPTTLPPTTLLPTTLLPTTTSPPKTTIPQTIPSTPCKLVVLGYKVTPCQPFTLWRVDWYNGEKSLGASRSSDNPPKQTTHGLRDNGWIGSPTRGKVSYTLIDGSTTQAVFVPFDPNANETVYAPFASAPKVAPPPTVAGSTTIPSTTLPPIKGVKVNAAMLPDSMKAVCVVANNKISLAFCKPLLSYSATWMKGAESIKTISKTLTNWSTFFFLSDLMQPSGATEIRVTVTFTDKTTARASFTDPLKRPAQQTVQVTGTPTPPAPCELSLELGDIRFCRRPESVSYQWWSPTAALSKWINITMVDTLADLPAPPVGTTRVLVTASFADRSRVDETYIPYTR
jgi:hypothetical protein